MFWLTKQLILITTVDIRINIIELPAHVVHVNPFFRLDGMKLCNATALYATVNFNTNIINK